MLGYTPIDFLAPTPQGCNCYYRRFNVSSQVETSRGIARRVNMHPSTHKRVIASFVAAHLPMNRIAMTLTSNPHVHRYHAGCGSFNNESRLREGYSSAFDMELCRPNVYTGEEVSRAIVQMLHHGIIALWNIHGGCVEAPHLHCVDTTLKMNAALEHQVRQWYDMGTSTRADEVDPFWIGFMRHSCMRSLKLLVRENMIRAGNWEE